MVKPLPPARPQDRPQIPRPQESSRLRIRCGKLARIVPEEPATGPACREPEELFEPLCTETIQTSQDLEPTD